MLTNIWNTQTGNSDGNQFQIDRLRVEVVVLHLSKYSVQSWVTVIIGKVVFEVKMQ